MRAFQARAGTAATQSPLHDQLDVRDERWHARRRMLLRLLIAFALVSPFFPVHRHETAKLWFLVPATAAFLVITDRGVLRTRWKPGRSAMAWVGVLIALGVAIVAVGGPNWVAPLAIAAAGAGRLAPTPRAAVAGGGCCVAAGLAVGLRDGITYGNGLALILVPAMGCFLAYAAARRNEMVDELRRTRAELARVAVADERLRIARDLHDLLGHSLSLITLKAELAGRVLGGDPGRAAQEIADLEAVARRSLGEVRAAVTSYRQPSLDAELAAARQMLAAAGMDCQVRVPAPAELPPDTDALLAWTVREGATNVVRHSGARSVTITVTVTGSDAAAEIADDGVGPGWDHGGRPLGQLPGGIAGHGSGLAGLAERARAAGAEISMGEGRGGKGFRLAVQVPRGRLSARPS